MSKVGFSIRDGIELWPIEKQRKYWQRQLERATKRATELQEKLMVAQDNQVYAQVRLRQLDQIDLKE